MAMSAATPRTRLVLDFLRAFGRSLRNSEDTHALLEAEELTSVWQMPRIRRELATHAEGRRLLIEQPLINSGTTEWDQLRALPSDRLGARYMAHLDANGLDPDALCVEVTRGPDPTSNYLLARIRQTHDIWHTMLGLGTEGYEEVLVHAFQWPQLRMNYSAAVVCFGTLKHFIAEARWRLLVGRAIRDALRAGQVASPLLAVHWEDYWDVPLSQLRQRLGVTPAEQWPSMRDLSTRRRGPQNLGPS